MNKQIKINLPLNVQVSKKKKFILNLNNFRNVHYQTLNKAKAMYHQYIAAIAPKLDYRIAECSIHYVYHHGNARKYDIANPVSIIDKFACDGLTHINYWEDDNNEVIKKVTYEVGDLDRKDPRCEMIITVLKEEKNGRKVRKNKTHKTTDRLRVQHSNGSISRRKR